MQSFTIEEFKKIHQAWKKSGLSVRDYCANTGIKESRFYYWKKRIEDGDSLPTPTGGFIPVKLNGKSCKLDSHITSGTCASDVLCELVYQYCRRQSPILMTGDTCDTCFLKLSLTRAGRKNFPERFPARLRERDFKKSLSLVSSCHPKVSLIPAS